MGFDTIPAIPADYPLYDWANWQSSLDALAPGVKTKNFQIAAWNAIVDSLADAITAAGQEWDTTYTTAAGAKITILDPKLYAGKFNSVRLNIDRQMYLDWPWAVRPEIRGYIEREDFLGRQDVGKACDLVYPEYILELVRKLNLLLEIMRGTGPIRDADAEQQSGTQTEAEACAGVGVPVKYTHQTTLLSDTTANAGKAAHVAVDMAIAFPRLVDAASGIGAPAYCKYDIPVSALFSGQSKIGVPFNVSPISYLTTVSVEAVSGRPAPFSYTINAYCGVSDSEAQIGLSLPTEVDSVMALSYVSAEPQQGESLPAAVCAVSHSTLAIRDIDYLRSAPVVCTGRSGTKVSCTVTDTAWLPPIWTNGGLWIRQVHDAPVQRENGELEGT